ncbi:hypothetical protein LINGRAHAP2_LOCUS13567, partial [Linum grandiflorum]
RVKEALDVRAVISIAVFEVTVQVCLPSTVQISSGFLFVRISMDVAADLDKKRRGNLEVLDGHSQCNQQITFMEKENKGRSHHLLQTSTLAVLVL